MRRSCVRSREPLPNVKELLAKFQLEPRPEKAPSRLRGQTCCALLVDRSICESHVFSTVKYYNLEPWNQGFPLSSNETIEVPKTLFEESVFDTTHPAGASGRRPMVCTEQEPFSLTLYQLWKCISPKETFLEFWMGTGSTAKAYLLALKQLKFLGYDAGSSCFSKIKKITLEMFVCQQLSVNSNIMEPKRLQTEPRRYLREMPSTVESWPKGTWEALGR